MKLRDTRLNFVPLLRTVGKTGSYDRRCPLCDGRDTSRSIVTAADTDPAHQMAILECSRCALAWQERQQRTSEMSLEYFNERYVAQEKGTYFDPARRSAVARLHLDWIERLGLRRRTLLDVGAGYGWVVKEAAKRGWSATGVEPAVRAVERYDGGGRMICGTLQDIPPSAKFDVITLLDVIEHVEDCPKLLAGVRARIADAGHIIVETGNYASAARIEAGSTWWCYQADHRWYYTPESLVTLMRRAGFDRFRVLRPRVATRVGRDRTIFRAVPQSPFNPRAEEPPSSVGRTRDMLSAAEDCSPRILRSGNHGRSGSAERLTISAPPLCISQRLLQVQNTRRIHPSLPSLLAANGHLLCGATGSCVRPSRLLSIGSARGMAVLASLRRASINQRHAPTPDALRRRESRNERSKSDVGRGFEAARNSSSL